MPLALSVYLDLLRLVAAMLVFFSHLQYRAFAGPMVWRVAGFGEEAVVAFFVLSGMVISYVANRNERDVRTFAIARASRLYSVVIPALLVTLLLDAIGSRLAPAHYLAVVPAYYSPETGLGEVLCALSFTNELWNGSCLVGSNVAYWSLGFEVAYYAAFACLMAFGRGWGLLAATALLIGAGPKIALYGTIWMTGWLAFTVISRLLRSARPPSWPLGVLLTAAPLMYIVLSPYVQPPGEFSGTRFLEDPHRIATWATYQALAIVLALHLVGIAILAPWLETVARRGTGPIRWAAGASFTLYLAHMPLVVFLAAVSPFRPGTVGQLLYLVGLTLAAVFLLAEIGERRKQAWRRAIERIAGEFQSRRTRIGLSTPPPPP